MILQKIICLVNDPSFTETDKKLKQALFNENDELYILLKNYCILYKNNTGDILLEEIPAKIQNLYQTDSKIKNFFDNC